VSNKMRQTATISPRLFLGSRASCAEVPDGWRILHIGRPDSRNCELWDRDGDLSIEYIDGFPIAPAMLTSIAEFVDRCAVEKRPILVHCASGVTRGPTTTLFVHALQTRKHPLTLIDEIYCVNWQHRGVISNIYHVPLSSIVWWWEEKFGRKLA